MPTVISPSQALLLLIDKYSNSPLILEQLKNGILEVSNLQITLNLPIILKIHCLANIRFQWILE